MPIKEYFGGNGERVKAQLQKKYGKDWEHHFYAIANAKGQNPKGKNAKNAGREVLS